jgi:surface antigen
LHDLMPSGDADDLGSQGNPTRRSLREAAAKPRSRAATRRARLSRPASDRKAVSRAVNSRAKSRGLRRSDISAMNATAPKAPRKHPLSVLAVMTVVGGMFAVAGLPAFAVTSDPEIQAVANTASQSYLVGANAAAIETTRDGYHATTPAQLAEATRDVQRAENNAEYLASGARELGDDYPWAYELSDEQGGGLSPLNYFYRECVDFVAWRLNRDAGSLTEPFKYVWSNLTPNGGNASQWKYAWDAHGWETSATPVVGSVAWFGYSNHVAYVKEVLDGGFVLIEEYNYGYSHVYGQRVIPAASVAAFLYPPS